MSTVEVNVVGDVSSLGRELKSGVGMLRDFGGRAGSVLKGVLGANLITAGVGAAVDGIKSLGGVLADSVSEAREAEVVGKTTAQIIKATGGAAKVSAGQVGDLAEALSNKTGIDDEAIQSGANLLLTFKNVRNEAGKGANIFDRANSAAVDLSKAGFGSIESSSKMLGKALNDPAKGITALSRAGVTFTDKQKSTIKSLTESGQILKAQKLILKEVESQVGGVAEANATAGDKAKVMAGNLKEQLGTALLPTLDRLAGFFTTTLGPAISAGIDQVAPLLTSAVAAVEPVVAGLIGLVSGIAAKITAGLSAGGGLSGFVAQLQPLAAVIVGIAAQVGPAVMGIAGQIVGLVQSLVPQVMGIATTVAAVVQAVLPSVLGVISTVISGVQTVAPIVLQVFGAIASAIQANLPAIVSAIGSIRETVSGLVSIIVSLWTALGPTILPIITSVFGTIVQVISGALKIVSGIVKVVAAVLKGDWSGAWEAIKQIVAGALQIITAVVRNAGAVVAGIFRALGVALGAIWGAIKAAASAAWNAVKTTAVAAWTSLVTTVKTKAGEVLTTVKAIPGKITSALGNLGSLLVESGKSLLSGLAQGIRDGIAGAIGAAKDAVSQIRSYFPFSPAKRGPFSGKGWTLYSGRAIGAALAQGLDQSQRYVKASALDLAEVAARPVAVTAAGVSVSQSRARTAASEATSSALSAVAASVGSFDPAVLAAAVERGARAGIEAHLRTLDPRQEYALVKRAEQFGRSRGGV